MIIANKAIINQMNLRTLNMRMKMLMKIKS